MINVSQCFRVNKCCQHFTTHITTQNLREKVPSIRHLSEAKNNWICIGRVYIWIRSFFHAMKSCKVLQKQHSRTFYCKMVRSFIEEIMGKNKKSRKIRSRNAKVDRTARHLEKTHMVAEGLLQRHLVWHHQTRWGEIKEGRMLETAGVSQAMAEKEDAAQNLEKRSQLQDLVSVDEREVPLERVKVHIRQFTLDDERIPALPFKGRSWCKGRKQPEGCRGIQKGRETDVEGEKGERSGEMIWLHIS